MAYRLRLNYAGVIVKKGKRAYFLTDEVGEPLTSVKAGTLLVELEEENVCNPDKQAIQPTGRFYRTAETIAPYHVILDIWDFSAVEYVGRM